MKLAVIADVHSSLQALQAVLEDLRGEGPDVVACAGDIVGYGARPNECSRLVRATVQHAVKGNHEISALTGDTAWMNPHAAKAAHWTAHALNAESRKFLESIHIASRFDLSGLSVAMYHGSVGNATEYVYEEQAHEEMLAAANCRLLILAHTHVPYFKKFERGMILNPGSVGQPRDGDPRASYALFDSKTDSCTVKRVDYDIEGAYEDIMSAGLPDFLAERLFFGR